MPQASTSEPEVVLRTYSLSKNYGKRLAVDGLELEVHKGRIFGFLGPNGAGKTTTISILLGLLRATDGHAELFGLDLRTHLSQALPRVGAVLEGQAYYPLLSARENLTIYAALTNTTDPKRIDAMIDLVGLAGRGRDKVRTYSQGMKQRLGLAAALLHDPELLVLDEPTNGLDPAGMREFRELIRELGRSGKTVFVSSHLLGEVEQMCDDVGIVKGGRLLTQGPVASMLGQTQGLDLVATDNDKAAAVLQRLDFVGSVTSQDGALFVEAPRERAADISRALAEEQIYLSELKPREGSLEDFFLEVTGEPDADA